MKLFTAATAIGDSTISPVGPAYRSGFRVAKVQITGTSATVILRGRMDANDPWTDLYTFTSSGMQAIVLPPYVKFSITAISAASVDAYIDAEAS